MAHITLISGSTLGGAEYVAEHLAKKLHQAGFTTTIHHGPRFEELPCEGIWLLITSTHGAGELPDNLQPCYDSIADQQPDLSNVRYGAIGIGNREYDTFCAALDKVNALLNENGAQQVGKLLRINIQDHPIPEDPAEQWLANWLPLL